MQDQNNPTPENEKNEPDAQEAKSPWEQMAEINAEADAVKSESPEPAAATDDAMPAVVEPAAESAVEDLPAEDAQELEISEEADAPEPYVPKLNEKQQKVIQIILGFLFGFAIWFFLWLGTLPEFSENSLVSWLWVVVFAIAMLGRNAIEKRTGVQLRIFMKYFLISLVIFFGLFLLWMLVINPHPFTSAK